MPVGDDSAKMRIEYLVFNLVGFGATRMREHFRNDSLECLHYVRGEWGTGPRLNVFLERSQAFGCIYFECARMHLDSFGKFLNIHFGTSSVAEMFGHFAAGQRQGSL